MNDSYLEFRLHLDKLNTETKNQVQRLKNRVKDLETRLSELEEASNETSKSDTFCFEALVRRIEALEDDQNTHPEQPETTCEEPLQTVDADDPSTLHEIALRMVDTLSIVGVIPEIRDTLRRAIREPMQQPTPEATPMATDDKLGEVFDHAEAVGMDPLRAVYNLGRQYTTAPPAAPAGGLAEKLAKVYNHGKPLHPAARCAVIHVVAAWIRSELNGRSVADQLEQEAGRGFTHYLG